MIFQEVENGNEQIADQEFIKDLAQRLLNMVDVEIKSWPESRLPKIIGINKSIGGDIERSGKSAKALVEKLRAKLESIVSSGSTVDLSSVNYNCLERVLNYLINKEEDCGENYEEDLSRLIELRQKYEEKN